MRNIFIFHGSYGNPQENWFPWLKVELEKFGHHVFCPQFPIPKYETPDGHRPEDWLKYFKKYHQYINEDTIMIAHSRGCLFSYYLLPTLETKIHSLFLIAPWINFNYKAWYTKGFQGVIDPYHRKPFQWNKIKEKTSFIEIFQSTNDDTPVKDGQDIANKLGAQLTIVENANHFNVASNKDYVKFPLLLEHIKKRP